MNQHVVVIALALLAGCGAKTGLTIPDVPMDAPPIPDAPDAPDTPPICIPGEFEIVPASADVVFVIDRSGSMRQAIDGDEMRPRAEWRWTLLGEALEVAFSRFDDRVRVGGEFYPDEMEMTIPPPPPAEACRSSSGIDVPISATGEAAILATFPRTDPFGGTPTAVAVAEAAAALRRAGSPRRFIVLATDGGPNCNDRLDARTCVCTSAMPGDCAVDLDLGRYACLDDTRTVRTISEAAGAGTPVFVIGIEPTGRPELTDVLERMAVAGGRPRMVPGERAFYSVASEAELAEALDAITGSISRCGFVSPSVPVDESTFSIEIDGVPVARTAWEWVDRARGELELGAEACARASRPGARIVAIVDDCP